MVGLFNILKFFWVGLFAFSAVFISDTQGADHRSEVLGAVYHVSIDGDDQNDGSYQSPWATVNHAVTRVTAGDMVCIHPGTYLVNEQISMRTSGEEGNPITLRGCSGRPVLDMRGFPGRNGLEIFFASHITLENLRVLASQERHSRGIRLTHADHVVLRNNEVSGAGHANLFCSFSNHVLFENNTAYNGLIGIYVADSSDYVIVRGNRLYGNQGIGLHMNGDISSGGNGTISFALIEQNLIFQNLATGINCDGVTDSVFRNNLLYGNTRRGIAFFRQDGAVPSNDNEVIHNTVVMPSSGYYAIGLNAGAVRNRFWNNIFLTEANVPVFASTSSGTSLEVNSDYNLLPAHGRIAEAPDGVFFTLDEWKGMGYDGNSLSGGIENTFVNPFEGDYRLVYGSPAIDWGTASFSSQQDILGHPRPYGKGPDMGCHEFQTTAYIAPSGFCASLVPCFSRIDAGLESQTGRFILQIQEGVYPEQVIVPSFSEIHLSGGWSSDFTRQDGFSRIQGLTIQSGSATVDRLILQ